MDNLSKIPIQKGTCSLSTLMDQVSSSRGVSGLGSFLADWKLCQEESSDALGIVSGPDQASDKIIP
jgi:hypothetical protein